MAKEAHKQPTLREIWGGILPRFLDKETTPAIPFWPPDVFALCAYALKQQSRYVRVVSKGWPPVQANQTLQSWAKETRQSALDWLVAWDVKREVDLPVKVSHLWTSR